MVRLSLMNCGLRLDLAMFQFSSPNCNHPAAFFGSLRSAESSKAYARVVSPAAAIESASAAILPASALRVGRWATERWACARTLRDGSAVPAMAIDTSTATVVARARQHEMIVRINLLIV